MRIIGGKKGGLKIFIKKKLRLRPTTDKCKEGLFNILSNRYDFEKLNILDLFSGTGNISYEFSSRGVNSVTAIELNKNSIDYINEFNKKNNFGIKIIKTDVFKFLKRCDKLFDLIFADPPYNFVSTQYYKLISLVFKNNLINNDGLLVIEHSSTIELNESDYYIKSRKYGSSTLSFYENITC